MSARRVRAFLSLPETASLPSIETMSAEEHDKTKEDKLRKPPIEETVPAASVSMAPKIGQDFPCNQPDTISAHSIDIQASSDSVFDLANIEEDDEELTDKNGTERSNGKIDVDGNDVPKLGEYVVSLKNATFSWENANQVQMQPNRSTSFQLNGMQRLSLNIPAGKLTVIVGSIGSGKSSLIAAILGEMRKISGKVTWDR